MVSPPAKAGLFDAITSGIEKLSGGAAKSETESENKNSQEAQPDPEPTPVREVPVPVKTVNIDAIPKTKKIILSNFVVEFQQRYEKKTNGFSILGFGGAGSSKSINDATLPAPGTLQTITNFAYLDLVKKLKTKGYEVIEVSNLSEKSKPSYEKLTKTGTIESGEVFNNIDGESVLFSPDGMISSLPNAGCTHYGSKKSMANLSNNMRMSSTGYQTQYENEIANGEGKVPLLKVWITVGFGDASANGGNAFISSKQNDFLGTTKTTVKNSANANATAGMFLKAEVTRFSLAVPTEVDYKTNHGCGITLNGNPTPADGDAFIRLGDRFHYDNSNILTASSQAGSVEITDTSLGGGIGIRSVKERVNDNKKPSTVNEQGMVLVNKGSQSSGYVSSNDLGMTSLHTVSEFATVISSDLYATSTTSMIHKVSDAFIAKLP